MLEIDELQKILEQIEREDEMRDATFSELMEESRTNSKLLLEKLLHLLYQEMSTSELPGTFASFIIAASDNSVYWMLNKNSASIIGEWLNITGRTEQVLKYSLLINGACATTAIDLHTSEKLVTSVLSTIRRLKIIPDYQRWFVTVIVVSSLISLFGVSGAVGLTYELYKNNKFLAVVLGSLTMFVNLFTTVFFFQSLLDRFRKSFIRRNEDEFAKLMQIQGAFIQLTTNFSQLDNQEFLSLKDSLAEFSSEKQHESDTFEAILNQIRPHFKNPNPEELNPVNVNTDNKLSPRTYLYSLPISLMAAFIYYNVGSYFFKTLVQDESGDSPEAVNVMVGICMSIMAHISVSFSAGSIIQNVLSTKPCCRQRYENTENKIGLYQIGKTIGKTIIATLAALATINLVDTTIKVESDFLRGLIYTGAIIQSSCVTMYCLLKTSPKEIVRHTYQEIGRLFTKKAHIEKDRYTNNMKTLVEQLELATNRDIKALYNMLNEYDLLNNDDEHSSSSSLLSINAPNL